MSGSLFDGNGTRKYITPHEGAAFVRAAMKEREAVSTFCLTLAFAGARISEVLALTTSGVDAADKAIVFETLKQQKKHAFRAMPVPRALIPARIETTAIYASAIGDEKRNLRAAR